MLRGTPSDEHRCKAIKRNGKRCKMLAVDDEEQVCLNHGATNLREARAAITRVAKPLVDIVADFIFGTDKCELCGRGYMTPLRLKAIEMFWDRGGLSAKLQVEHSGSMHMTLDHNIIVEKMTDEELAAVDEIMDRVMTRVAAEESVDIGGE